MWPLVGARAASILLLLGVIVALRRPARVERASAALTLAAGLGDMAANVLFLLAAREGLLSITGVLFALYPAATVLLAVTVLRERLAGLQVAGLGIAIAAVTAIALA
jgi:drug/metabolite transporter (DMT)-like permease